MTHDRAAITMARQRPPSKLKRRPTTVSINGVECTVYDSQQTPTMTNVFNVPVTPWLLTYPVTFHPRDPHINTPHRWLMHMVEHVINLGNGVYDEEEDYDEDDEDDYDDMTQDDTTTSDDDESLYDTSEDDDDSAQQVSSDNSDMDDNDDE